MKKSMLFILSITLMFAISTVAMADIANNAISSTESSSGSTAIIEKGAFQDNREYNTENNGSKMKRYFAPAGEMNYPGAPGRFDADPDTADNAYMLMTIKDINEYDVDGQTTKDAKNMVKGAGSQRVMVRSKRGTVPEDQRLDLDTPMNVVYTKQEGMKSLGIIVIVSDSKKSISADVFAKAQVEAWKLGGTVMHVKVQGWQKLVRNSGAGIGFTWIGTTISGGQSSAATGVMGAGYAWGEAGYYKHPFIIMHVLAPM